MHNHVIDCNHSELVLTLIKLASNYDYLKKIEYERSGPHGK